MLCTDGLHDVLTETELGRLADDGDAAGTAQALVAAAITAGSRDNVTVAVVDGIG